MPLDTRPPRYERLRSQVKGKRYEPESLRLSKIMNSDANSIDEHLFANGEPLQRLETLF